MTESPYVFRQPARIATRGGITIGTVLAVILSWAVNHSIGWAILHGLLSWVYVIWCVFVHPSAAGCGA